MWHGKAGEASHRGTRSGEAGQARLGASGYGMVWRGKAGMVSLDVVSHGEAGVARRVLVMRGAFGQGRHGEFWHGEVWCGPVGQCRHI